MYCYMQGIQNLIQTMFFDYIIYYTVDDDFYTEDDTL